MFPHLRRLQELVIGALHGSFAPNAEKYRGDGTPISTHDGMTLSALSPGIKSNTDTNNYSTIPAYLHDGTAVAEN